jgi:hypothetical protein
MLAEKFFLFLETVISHLADTTRYPDGAPKVVSRARHVPIQTSAAYDGLGEIRSRRPSPVPRPGSMATKNTRPNPPGPDKPGFQACRSRR